MQVCVSTFGLAKYVVKYATKSEPQSTTLAQTFQMIVDGLDKRDPSRKVVSKLLMKSIGERDYSAQETCHLITGDKLVTASREFKTLHLKNKREIDLSARSSKASATVPTTVEEYMKRSAEAQNLCLMDYDSDYTYNSKGQLRKRGKSLVVRVVPRIPCDPTNAKKYEQYCYYQLMKYKPFCQLSDLTTAADGEVLSAADSYKRFLITVGKSLRNKIEISNDIDAVLTMPFDEASWESDDDSKKENKKKGVDQDDWMKLFCPSSAINEDLSMEELNA